MSEFIKYTKEVLSRGINAYKLNSINGAKGLPTQALISPKPKQQQPDPIQDDFPFGKLFAGPRLRHWQRYGHYYLPVFKNKGWNNIKSVGRIWKPNFYARRPSTDLTSKMHSHVQILSTPTADTPGTTLVLHFDNKRYLIGNVAEGTQRAAVQRKLGMLKVGDIFLTGTVGWGTTGGILGMILTIADSSTSSREELKVTKSAKGVDTKLEKHWLNIHGGKNLTHLLATARRFVFRKGMPIHTQEFLTGKDAPNPNWAPTWEDDMINVWAMVIEPDGHIHSPRKRSHDVFATDSENLADRKEDSTEADEAHNSELRKAVVADMFDSEWRLDALFKKKLSEVKMPAQIFLRNEEGKMEKYTGPMPKDGEDFQDIEVLVRNPWPGAMIEALPSTTPAMSSVCYIMKTHPQRGKFDTKAALKLKVPKGPSFARLARGENVTLEDGTVITPDKVLGPTKDGSGFAVVELPTISYIETLLRREEWSSKEVMNGVEMIIWILGPGVAEDPRLHKFMRDHDALQHIVSSQDICSNFLALESPASAAIRLHLVDRERFPIPVHSNAIQPLSTTDDVPFERARVGMTFVLQPRFGTQDDKIIQYLDTAKVVEEASPEVQSLADIARKEVTSDEFLAKLEEQQKTIPSPDAEVITLGTGSALPSKYRNVSATLLRVPGYGNYLFDCGENTIGQLRRVFGEELSEVLRNLKAIWISHLHADHHLGTASVIKAWNEETKKDSSTQNNKLVVASDNGMLQWLEEYSEIEEYGYSRVQPISMGNKSHIPYEWHFDKQQRQSVGLSNIKACRVSHCNGALAVVFNFPNGLKVAYSGDCRPSKHFAQIGQGATLLIHEATFDDELQGDAIAKKHSTTAEAIDVGRQMNARRILLTHFSQRYQKIPVMENRDGKDQVVVVAFDYMRVKIGDIAKLEAFRPALIKLFEEKEVEKEA